MVEGPACLQPLARWKRRLWKRLGPMRHKSPRSSRSPPSLKKSRTMQGAPARGGCGRRRARGCCSHQATVVFFCGFLRPLSSDSRGPTAATTILRRLSLMRTGSAVACTTSLMGRQAPRQCKHTSNCGHKIVRDRRLLCSRIRGRRRLHSDTVPR